MTEAADATENAQPTPPRKEPMPPAKRWIIAAVVAYLVFFVSYFVFPAAAFPKYVIAIGGILLGTVVREAADKEWKSLRIVAIALPLVAVAVLQAFESHKAKEARIAILLEELRKSSRAAEAKQREALVADPRDSIEAIRDADRGFLAKAELLAARAGSASRQDAARLRKLAAAYRAASGDFAKLVKPLYAQMLKLDEKSERGRREFKARLDAALRNAAAIAGKRDIAGLYNHAGALAQAARRGDLALAYFYRALTLEPDHLPAYESVGYALWIHNEDAHGALQFAVRGLEQTVLQRAQAGDRKIAPRYARHLAAMESRLRLQYAYFSAVLYRNAETARRYAEEELKSTPDDAEAQDTMGYVRLRFASSTGDVEKAMEHLRKAIDNPEAERITKRLAAAHLQQAQELLARFP